MLVYTAVIHLRRPLPIGARHAIEPLLRVAPGVEHVTIETGEPLIAVRFDRDQTGLADLVRLIEDFGSRVTGVAQRRTRRAG